MKRAEIEDAITAIIEPMLTDTAIELVDVEYVQEKDWYLRIFIDKENGVGIEDCEQLSRLVEPVLDELTYLTQAYYLEVSSPGLDRVLRKEKDYSRYAGRRVDIKFFHARAGVKEITAVLKGLFEGDICIETGGREERLPFSEVAQVRLHVEMGSRKK